MSDKPVSSLSRTLRKHKWALGLVLGSAVVSAFLYIARKRRREQWVDIEGDGETGRVEEEALRTRAGVVGSVKAVVKLNLRANRYLGSCRCTFLLKSQQSCLNIDFAGSKLLEFRLDHKSIRPAWRQGVLELGELGAGMHEVEVRFEGKYSTNGLIKHENAVFFSGSPGNRQLHRILPCFDQPDIKATWQVLVAAPSHWQVLGLDYSKRIDTFEGCCPDSDVIFDMTEGETCALHEFYPSAKVSPEHFSLCAGLFAVVTIPSKPTIFIYSRPEVCWKVDLQGLVETVQKALRHFKAASGVPYPFPKLDLVFLPTTSSYAASVLYLSEDLLSDIWAPAGALTALEEVLLQELAAQWVGVVVTYKSLQEYSGWTEVARQLVRDMHGETLMSPSQASALKRVFSLYKWGNCARSALNE